MGATARSQPPPHERQLDLVFQALADQTRRQLLDMLSRGPHTISELAEPFEMSLPGISKHLRVLERAGLLKRSVTGRIHRCSLEAAPMEEARAWVECYRPFWEENLDGLATYLEQQNATTEHASGTKEPLNKAAK